MGNVAMPITTEKAQDFERSTQTITTLEIAEMMEVEHGEILKKLEGTTKPDGSVKQVGIIPVLSEGDFPVADYFQESTYLDAQGKPRKCYNVTRLGCDFLANKFTGEKGILFTARYVKRFHDMEDVIVHKNIVDQTPFLLCLQGVKFVADDLRVSEASKLYMYNKTFEEFGLPTGFLPKYEDNGSREQCSASELLKRNRCSIGAVKFNQLLIEIGYLEERERASSKGGKKKFKALTDKGLKYGVNLINEKNQKEVQPYYYADTFMELFEDVQNYRSR